LTDRELEALRLLAAGRSNQRIGYDLVSRSTRSKDT
jgi:DNA-binding CsgD family transcriptional regulator